MDNKRRMLIQELAIVSFVRNGEAFKKEIPFLKKSIYKMKVENPWVPSYKL